MLSARRRRWPSGLQALPGLPTSKREEADLTCTQARNPANLPLEKLTAMLRLKRTPKDIISALPPPPLASRSCTPCQPSYRRALPRHEVIRRAVGGPLQAYGSLLQPVPPSAPSLRHPDAPPSRPGDARSRSSRRYSESHTALGTTRRSMRASQLPAFRGEPKCNVL